MARDVKNNSGIFLCKGWAFKPLCFVST